MTHYFNLMLCNTNYAFIVMLLKAFIFMNVINFIMMEVAFMERHRVPLLSFFPQLLKLSPV